MIADNGYIPEHFNQTGLHVFYSQIEKLPGSLRAKRWTRPRIVIDSDPQLATPGAR